MDLLDLLIQQSNERNRDNKLEEFQDELNAYLEHYRNDPNQEFEIRTILDKMRHSFPYELVKQKGGVFITENERCNIKELCCKDSDLFRLHGRLILPIISPKGNTLGLIGWDPTAVPKYMDSRHIGYTAKASSFFNMQIIPDIIDTNETVFIVEGVWCSLWLEHMGYKSFAMLGSKVNKQVKKMLTLLDPSRFIFVWDNDEAGMLATKDMKKSFPMSRYFCLSNFNDIDEARRSIDLSEDINNMILGNNQLEHFHRI